MLEKQEKKKREPRKEKRSTRRKAQKPEPNERKCKLSEGEEKQPITCF